MILRYKNLEKLNLDARAFKFNFLLMVFEYSKQVCLIFWFCFILVDVGIFHKGWVLAFAWTIYYSRPGGEVCDSK